MVSLETFRKSVLNLPGAEEALHFNLVVFGVRKKNFASFDPRTGELSLKLRKSDPKRLEGIEREVLTIAPGKYGEHGWTTVDMGRIDKSEFTRLLHSAHQSVSDSAKSVVEKSKRAV